MGCRTSRNETSWLAQVEDLPDEELLSPDVDPKSAGAKIAIRRASKDFSKATERTAIFEVATGDESKVQQDSEPSDAVGGVNEVDELEGDGSMLAVHVRKASKREVNLAHRVSYGTEEVQLGETPLGIQQMGVKLSPQSAELQRQRSSSKGAVRKQTSPDSQNTLGSNVCKSSPVEDVVAGDESPRRTQDESEESLRRAQTENHQTPNTEEEKEEEDTDAINKDSVTVEQVAAAVTGAGVGLRAAAVAPISEDAAMSDPFKPMEHPA